MACRRRLLLINLTVVVNGEVNYCPAWPVAGGLARRNCAWPGGVIIVAWRCGVASLGRNGRGPTNVIAGQQLFRIVIINGVLIILIILY